LTLGEPQASNTISVSGQERSPVHDDIDWLVVVGRIAEEPLPPRRQDALAKSGSNLGYDQPPP
jgi:hypothetical protein